MTPCPECELNCCDCNEPFAKRIGDLEAQAAAMRRTLETLDRLGGLGYDKHDWIKAALASDAGKRLLERLEKAEGKAANQESRAEWAEHLQLQNPIRVRAKALEDAAKVTESATDTLFKAFWKRHPDGPSATIFDAIADAIRALKDKP